MTPRLLFVAPLLAVAALAGACGGSTKTSASNSTTTTTTAGGASSFAAARAKFTSCLESHGVPASEATQGFSGFRGRGAGGTGTGSGTSTPASTPPSTPPTTTAVYGAAFTACRSDLPTGFGRGGGGGFTNSAAGRAYLQCLQLHGVTVPTTVPGSTGGQGGAPGGGFNNFSSNPNFQAARTACASLAPARPGSTSTTTAGGAA